MDDPLSNQTLQWRFVSAVGANWTQVKVCGPGKDFNKLVAATISIAVESCLTNHVFTKGGQSYLQPFSGVIGLDLMRCLAEIYMMRWIFKLKGKMTTLSNLPIVVINDEAEDIVASILDMVWSKTKQLIEPEEKEVMKHQKQIKCNKCEKALDTKTELLKHMKLTHKVHKCDKCEFETEKVMVMSIHKKKGQCFKDNGKLSNKVEAKLGASKQVPMKPKEAKNEIFMCKMCNKNFLSQGQLQKHATIIHKQFKCTICDYTTNKQVLMDKHVSDVKNCKIGPKLNKKTSQVTIRNFLSKPKWTPTETDIANKKLIEATRHVKLKSIGPDLLPTILCFYVDDGLFHGKATQKGIRYNSSKNRLELSTNQLEKDKDLPPDTRMINLILEIGNSIDKDIVLTGDCPSLNPNNFMPLLDTQVRLQKSAEYPAGEIVFRHYRKPMASQLTIQFESALPQKQKITILSQEVLRILRNTHPNSGDYWKDDLSDFMQRLKNSNWPEGLRLRILKSGICGWFKILTKELVEGVPRYRHINFNKEAREKAKIESKNNWFKSKTLADEDQPEAVLIIDSTPNSEIKTIFEEELKKSSLKIRVIERPGPKVQFTAMATNANPREKCQPGECMICDTKGGGNCRSKEITYEITCKGCKSGYDGQSGRNGFTRGREHKKLASSEDPKVREKSFMYRHKMDDHKGDDLGWEMKVLNKFPKKPLDRLVEESQNIIRRPKELSLNSKTEYAKSSLVQVRFISDTKQEKLDKLTAKKAIESDKERYKQVVVTRTDSANNLKKQKSSTQAIKKRQKESILQHYKYKSKKPPEK